MGGTQKSEPLTPFTLESQAQSRVGASYECGAAGATPFHAAELLAGTFEAATMGSSPDSGPF